MVNPPPNNDGQPRTHELDGDELIALVIAFLAVGTLLFWGMTRGDRSPLRTFNTPRPLEDMLLEENGALEAELKERNRHGDRLRTPRVFADPAETASPRETLDRESVNEEPLEE